AQDLDPVQVEGLRQRLVGIEGEGAHLDRRVVEVDAGGAGAAGRGDGAYGDVVGARVVDVDARREACDIQDVLDAANVHGILIERGDADRHLAQAFLVA